jgi:hypothetical protein
VKRRCPLPHLFKCDSHIRWRCKVKCPACLTDNPATRKFCRECRTIGLQSGADNLSEDKRCGECSYSQMQLPAHSIRLLSRQLLHPQVPGRKDSEEQKMYAPKPASAVGLVATSESLLRARTVGFLRYLVSDLWLSKNAFALPLMLIVDFFKADYRLSSFCVCQNNH